jgi:hypothetical protein
MKRGTLRIDEGGQHPGAAGAGDGSIRHDRIPALRRFIVGAHCLRFVNSKSRSARHHRPRLSLAVVELHELDRGQLGRGSPNKVGQDLRAATALATYSAVRQLQFAKSAATHARLQKGCCIILRDCPSEVESHPLE